MATISLCDKDCKASVALDWWGRLGPERSSGDLAGPPSSRGGDGALSVLSLFVLSLVAASIVAAGGASAGGSGPPSGLTAYGRTVWNLDALLHDTFGKRTVYLNAKASYARTPRNFSTKFIDNAHSEYYIRTFANAQVSTFHTVGPTPATEARHRCLRVRGPADDPWRVHLLRRQRVAVRARRQRPCELANQLPSLRTGPAGVPSARALPATRPRSRL